MRKYFIFAIIFLILASICLYFFCPLTEADSTGIIFISNQGQGFFVYTMDSNGKNVSLLIEKQFFSVSVSKTKDKIILNNETGIYVSDITGNNISLVLPAPDTGQYENAKLSPDNSQIVFVKSLLVDPVQNKWYRNVYIFKIGSDKPIKLTDSKLNIFPSFSSDGKKIVYVSKAGNTPQLFIVDLETKKSKKITSLEEDYLEHPSFSPNGKKILFDTIYGLYTINADGTGLFEIVCNPTYFFTDPSWSPDGKKIAYLMARNQEGANFDIYTADPKNGEEDPVNLTNTPGGNITYGCPQWY